MQRELDRGHDAEVAAAAAQRPEQLGMLVRGGADRLAGRGHELDGEHVVAGEAVLALEPAGAAAEREARDAGARHAAADGGEAVLLGRGVDLGPGQPAAHARDPALGVDHELAQAADVDHEAVLDERQAGDGVAAAAHRDAQVARPRERERGAHLVRVRAARDVARPRLDHAVEERAGVLVLGLAGVVEMAPQRVAELVQGGVMDDRHSSPRRRPVPAIPAVSALSRAEGQLVVGHARGDPLGQEAEVLEQRLGGRVERERGAGEGGQPGGARQGDEPVAERRAEAAPLPLVDDREGHLRAVGRVRPRRVAADADDRADAVDRDERDVAALVDLGQEGELAGAQPRLGAEEAPAPRLLAEAGEERREPGLVVRRDRADREGRGHVLTRRATRARRHSRGAGARTPTCMAAHPEGVPPAGRVPLDP